MIENITENLKGIVLILVFIGLIALLAYGISQYNEEHEARQAAAKAYIHECVKAGRSVVQIGNGFTTEAYLVCNPK